MSYILVILSLLLVEPERVEFDTLGDCIVAQAELVAKNRAAGLAVPIRSACQPVNPRNRV